MMYLTSILKALAFAISGALILEALLVFWNRQGRRRVGVRLEDKLGYVFYGLGKQRQAIIAGTDVLHAASEYLVASGRIVSMGIGKTEGNVYANARVAWLALLMAIKREVARRTLVIGPGGESDFGLRELAILGQEDDIERIEQMLAADQFKGSTKELAKKALEKIRTRAAGV